MLILLITLKAEKSIEKNENEKMKIFFCEKILQSSATIDFTIYTEVVIFFEMIFLRS